MKVLLVNPPNLHYIDNISPDFVMDNIGTYPPLGLLYLAAYIKDKSPETVIEIMDCQVKKYTDQEIKEKIISFSPDIIGISVSTFLLNESLDLAKTIKSINSKILIVFGGPHPTIYPRETIIFDCVDYLIRGDGEKPFYELLKRMENKNDVSDIGGLVLKNEKQIIDNGISYEKDLDSLPFPARELVYGQGSKYGIIWNSDALATSIITSRGCPYNCLFCDQPYLNNFHRSRTSENILSEIKDCLSYGIREFVFYDDTFTIERDRVMKLCDLIIKEELNISWGIRTRVDRMDEVLLRKLKKAGCRRIHYGVESGTDKILKIIRKNISLDQVNNIFKITKNIGIETLAYFMIGNPHETKKDIEDTMRFAIKLDPDYIHATIVIPFPATELYAMALKKNIIKNDVWKEFAKSPNKDFQPPFWEEYLNRNELNSYISIFYKKFYFRFSYLIKRLFSIRSFGDFKVKLKTGLSMLK